MDLYEACEKLNELYSHDNYYFAVFQNSYIYTLDREGNQQQPEHLTLEGAIEILSDEREL